MKGLLFKPVDRNNWRDLEALFESRGGPHNCWCMVWRKMDKPRNQATKQDKKEALHDFVNQNIVIGILGYHESEPVVWCSIAPRDSYRDLSGNNSLNQVWSLVCFFIKKEFRKKHLTVELIKAAMKFAKENGAQYLEAYPVDSESPSYRFMGTKPTFEKMGFQFKHKAGSRRNVMVIEL